MKKDQPTGNKVTKKAAITPRPKLSSKQLPVKCIPPDSDTIKKLKKQLSNAVKNRNLWRKWCRETDQELFDLQMEILTLTDGRNTSGTADH